MLKIEIHDTEAYDPSLNEFVTIKGKTIVLEHSLVSISKWESKWHKPYLSDERKTTEQVYDYIKCMTLTQNVDDRAYMCISQEEIKRINDYIQDSMTATWFNDKDKKRPFSREIITSEVIYYWMIALGIPMECQKWHLNRLLTLIRVCEEKNKPKEKMSRRDLMARNKALNAARRKKHNTRG